MDLDERLKILGRSARFDLCGDCDLKGTGRVRAEGDRWEYPELVPDGKNSVMLRVLLSNRCVNDCPYCENAAGRDFRAARVTPDETAARFAELYRAGRARSLFLSSAVEVSAEHAMTRIVDTLELVRFRYRIPAYIHAKVLPGASDDLVRRALDLATRVSVNLEVPNRARMERLGAPKDFDGELFGRIRFISSLIEERSAAARRPPSRGRYGAASGRSGHPGACGRARKRASRKSQTTQFVVGAARETDREILETASRLYGELKLSRLYFSAFQPPGRVDFGAPRAPLLREHRLYQVDFLLRKYGFGAEEIPLEGDGNLGLHEDPKTAWARRHREFFPVEINEAPRRALLRVPGLGPVAVRRILEARRRGKIASPVHLRELGIRPGPALPYLLLDGARTGKQAGGRIQETLPFSPRNVS